MVELAFVARQACQWQWKSAEYRFRHGAGQNKRPRICFGAVSPLLQRSSPRGTLRGTGSCFSRAMVPDGKVCATGL